VPLIAVPLIAVPLIVYPLLYRMPQNLPFVFVIVKINGIQNVL
jgi:hypothetical protein